MISYGNLLAYKLIERVPGFFFKMAAYLYTHSESRKSQPFDFGLVAKLKLNEVHRHALICSVRPCCAGN
jgi:hypothetical protein